MVVLQPSKDGGCNNAHVQNKRALKIRNRIEEIRENRKKSFFRIIF